jgi:hypothetical protein
MKLDLLTYATVVEDAVRFVSHKSKDKEKLKSCSSNSNEDDKEESNEPDYSEYKQTEEDGTEKKTISTINKIF